MKPASLRELASSLTDEEFETLLRLRVASYVKQVEAAGYRFNDVVFSGSKCDKLSWRISFGNVYPYVETRAEILGKAVVENFRRLGFENTSKLQLLDSEVAPEAAPTPDDEIPF